MSLQDDLRHCRENLSELDSRHTDTLLELRLQTEATRHSEREALRLSRLLQEAQHDVSRLRECRDTWRLQAETVVSRNTALSTVLAYIAGSGCDRCSSLAEEALKGQSS